MPNKEHTFVEAHTAKDRLVSSKAEKDVVAQLLAVKIFDGSLPQNSQIYCMGMVDINGNPFSVESDFPFSRI